MTKLADNVAALREREFRKLVLGQATSIVGVMFTVFALPFAVLEIGGTATDIGIVEAANLVPLAVFLLIGGVWADRLPRQRVMLVADFLRFALQCTTAALLIAGDGPGPDRRRPAQLALAGPLSDAFGVSTVLWAGAAVAAAVSIFQLSWRDARSPKDMGPRGAATQAPVAGSSDG